MAEPEPDMGAVDVDHARKTFQESEEKRELVKKKFEKEYRREEEEKLKKVKKETREKIKEMKEKVDNTDPALLDAMLTGS